jgi:hypothetical protein
MALGTGAVHGAIHLADTGKAATGAIVGLSPPVVSAGPAYEAAEKGGEFVVKDQPQRGDFHATVDSAGNFEIDNVTPGDYYVSTYLPGYLSQDDYIYPGALSPELNPGASNIPSFVQKIHVTPGNTVLVNLQLERGGSIEGTARFGDGRPAHMGGQIVNEVAISLEVKTKSGKFIHAGGVAHTDSSGHYRIDGVAPASYVVIAAIAGKMVPTKRGLESGDSELIYASSTVRASQARAVEVQGTTIQGPIDIEIPVVGLHTVSGKVIATTGEIIDEGIVRLYPTGEPGISHATPIRTDGTFSFEKIPDEEYTVSVELHGKTEFLGLTADKTGLRMRISKPPYLPVSENIRVAGQDSSAILLRLAPAP